MLRCKELLFPLDFTELSIILESRLNKIIYLIRQKPRIKYNSINMLGIS